MRLHLASDRPLILEELLIHRHRTFVYTHTQHLPVSRKMSDMYKMRNAKLRKREVSNV